MQSFKWLLLIFFLLSETSLVFAKTAATNQALIHFLTISDIHFDPFFYCDQEKPCPLIDELRVSEVKAWPALFAAYEVKPSHYKQDTNYPLLIGSLTAAKKIANEENVQFVLVLGDMLGHEYDRKYHIYSSDKTKAGYRAFVKKTLQFLNNEIGNAFPFANIYLVLGNNDSYAGDYYSNPRDIFFKDVASIWATLIKNKKTQIEFQKQFVNAGYYALDLPMAPDLRLIALNTNLFSAHARGKGITNTAKQQLVWLQQELAQAKKNNKKVLIMMHIPLGIDIYQSLRFHFFRIIEFWKPVFTQGFQSLLDQYAEQIAGIFSGHLHSDSFQILTYGANEIAWTGIPSVSPIFGGNPGFKIYAYSTAKKELIDFVSYYYPINETRAFGLEYQFNRFSQPNCHPCPLITGIDKMTINARFANYATLFYKTQSANLPNIAWFPFYWCAINEMTGEDYKICAG